MTKLTLDPDVALLVMLTSVVGRGIVLGTDPEDWQIDAIVRLMQRVVPGPGTPFSAFQQILATAAGLPDLDTVRHGKRAEAVTAAVDRICGPVAKDPR